jgi:hypothetical protein
VTQWEVRKGNTHVVELRQLDDFELSAPDTWAPLPDEPRSGWCQDAAEQLCDGKGARATLARRLQCLQPRLTDVSHLLVAVWVPHRASPKVAGLLYVDRVVPAGRVRIDREWCRNLIEPDPRSGARVFAHYVDDVDLPAGPGLLVSEIVAEPASRWFPWSKEVRENLIYIVFPPGCSDALKLTFSAKEEFGERMEVEAAATMDTLTVSLGEVRSR